MELKKRDDNVLAEGEVTNHYHRAQGATAVFEAPDGTRLFDAPESGVTITHEEHGPISLPAGEYVSGRVREYDHFAEEARTVQD